MKLKNLRNLAVIMGGILLLSCAPSQKFSAEAPQPGKSLLVGAILVENVGLEDVYEAKTANIKVVIIGKSAENGREVTQAYHVKTNADGYYMIQNVPPGAYVLKGIEVDLGYETRMIISSRWEGNTQQYYPVSLMIDNIVREWPPASDQRVIDMRIRYFRIDAAKRIMYDDIESLSNAKLAITDKRYTMPDPEAYFREKFPDWGWFSAN
ncbi:MAG: carboxypeptidase-like regulatory domain-containing protein [Candidatus Marinimicrobia bacterium]|nr:carboxypeptidase-like regulatory domain-containing protein [Candidatus Neomarinimicrobiota bacterium]MCF7830214.1 carboxypeptidase-like regulatory domain-containing protein [Candidatus Neomarinimicrobiota bacterium]MCF7880831.1 carboxypeptidase-like regulatory domain-containing protein [Candidatus Neomarinimicrobiota bacterium]